MKIPGKNAKEVREFLETSTKENQETEECEEIKKAGHDVIRVPMEDWIKPLKKGEPLYN